MKVSISTILEHRKLKVGIQIPSSIGVGGTRTFSNLMTPLTLFNETP